LIGSELILEEKGKMKTDYLMMDLTWQEIQQAIQDERILIFCVGAVEQHGYHMPVGVDVFLPMEVAARVAKRVGGVVAPCTNYGYKSLLRAGGGPHFVGSVGLRGATVIALVKDIFENFLEQGWRRFVVIDWHLENVPFVFEGVDEALRETGSGKDVKVIKIDNPNGLGVRHDPGLEADLFGADFPGWAVEHAAIWETSAMMAAYPEKVQTDKIVDGSPPVPFEYDILPVPQGSAPESGVFWKASQASKEKGERIWNAVVNGITEVIKFEFGIEEERG
jgi:creatinine amidohydrolase